MSPETLKLASYLAFSLGGVFLLAAVYLFITNGIPSLIGDISGRTARKTIAAIRYQNELEGPKVYKPSPVNIARGKITDKISPSGNILPRQQSGANVNPGTEKLNSEMLAAKAFFAAAGTEGHWGLAGPGTELLGISIEAEIKFIHTDEVIA